MLWRNNMNFFTWRLVFLVNPAKVFLFTCQTLAYESKTSLFFCNHRYTSSCKQEEPVVPKEVYSLEGIFLPQDWFLYTFAFINLSLPPFAPSLYLHPSIALSLHYLPIYSYFTQSTSLHLFYYHLFLLSFLNLSLFFPHVSFSHFIKTAHLDPFSVPTLHCSFHCLSQN